MQESEVSRLEDTVCYLKSQKYKEKCSEAAEQKYKKKVERLHGNVEELEQEREELECEVAELRRAQKRSTHRWEQCMESTERKCANTQTLSQQKSAFGLISNSRTSRGSQIFGIFVF